MDNLIARCGTSEGERQLGRSSLGKGRRWLEVHERWKSSFETAVRLAGVSWIATSFVSWLLLNAYLREIGQRGVPLDLTGTWAVLVLMGGCLVLTLAALGSMFIVGEQLMQPLHPKTKIPSSTRWAFFLAAAAALCTLFGLETWTGRPMIAAAAAMPVGLAAGLITFRFSRNRVFRLGYGELVGLLAAWIALSALLFLVLAVDLDTVLRLQVAGTTHYLMALSLSLLQMLMCAFLPRMWIYGVTLTGVAWLTVAVSPGPYVVVLTALYATNQGGGLPAEALVSKKAATICNLGTSSRAILYRAEEGCSKQVALSHLRQLVAASSAPAKAELIESWRGEILNPQSSVEK